MHLLGARAKNVLFEKKILDNAFCNLSGFICIQHFKPCIYKIYFYIDLEAQYRTGWTFKR